MLNWEKQSTYVVLKFHHGRRGSVNTIISKTMGRIAVISYSYQGKMPQAGTFWLCKIENELSPDKSKGCFIVQPVREVPLEKVMKLVPGMYETEIIGSTVVCKPRVEDHFWIIPFSLKRYFIQKDKTNIQYQSVIVPIQFSETQVPQP